MRSGWCAQTVQLGTCCGRHADRRTATGTLEHDCVISNTNDNLPVLWSLLRDVQPRQRHRVCRCAEARSGDPQRICAATKCPQHLCSCGGGLRLPSVRPLTDSLAQPFSLVRIMSELRAPRSVQRARLFPQRAGRLRHQRSRRQSDRFETPRRAGKTAARMPAVSSKSHSQVRGCRLYRSLRPSTLAVRVKLQRARRSTKSRIRSKRVPLGIDSQEDEVDIPRLQGTLEGQEGRVALAEARVHERHRIRAERTARRQAFRAHEAPRALRRSDRAWRGCSLEARSSCCWLRRSAR